MSGVISAILAGNATVPEKIVATGGTVYIEGNYKVHVFTSTGTFSISQIRDSNATLDVLVIGGGYIGNAGDSSLYDYDGKNGGAGGGGAFSRLYSNLTFGTYFNATNYTATVGGANTNDSQLNNKTASPFTCLSGNVSKQGGAGGSGAVFDSAIMECTSPSTAGGNGQGSYVLNWLSTNLGAIYYAGGGSGGGGGGSDGGCGASPGGFLSNGEAQGGAGGNFESAGSDGGNANQYGGGGGGGGGAGSNNESGVPISGGSPGNGNSGAIFIRYLFK